MRFRSTRSAPGTGTSVGIADALEAGLAPDGGLFVPESFPELERGKAPLAMGEAGRAVLEPFFRDEPVLAQELPGLCERAFDFPVPVRPVDSGTGILELFHGPTAAFKDVGARFLAECVSALARSRQGGPRDSRPRVVLVATSGDTGGAVAAAFFGKPAVEVVILYPKGKISPLQEAQLTAWGGNVRAYAVRGDFDDCQRLVKEALADPEWRASFGLLSANSISLGRILPQCVYYAMASVNAFAETGEETGFIVPSGNLGNATAALWAKRMGFPIGKVVLACNANRAVLDYLATGRWQPRPTVSTLANAMDVGNPSNMERLRDLFPTVEALRAGVEVFSVTDEEIRETIRSAARAGLGVFCPHTATGLFTREKLGRKAGPGGHWLIAATAHPGKFRSVVEPLVGQELALPPSLERFARVAEGGIVRAELEPELSALRRRMG
ncbi:MAG: threonine synthase [Oligoflexia bacterium]|nr:threonine synthase [Oligoflexia bacterium]